MDLVLKYRNSIYGFLILWIVFFHIERVIGMPVSIPIVTPFIQRGNAAVDVFFFLSGFCLCLSLNKNNSLKCFYSKRFNRVVISYLIIAIPFFIWKSIEEFSSMRLAHFFFDLSGLSFWQDGCQNAWFVHAIIVFYIITPLLFWIVSNGLTYSLICVGALYVLNILVYLFYPTYHLSGIAWARLPIFLIGLIMGYYFPHFDFHSRKYFVVLSVLLGVALLLFVPSSLKGFYSWLLYAFIVIPLLWVLSSSFKIMPKAVNSVFLSIGNVSLEIYLCHIMIWHILRFYRLEMSVGMWIYFILPVISFICSIAVAKISNRMINKNIIKV